MTSYLTFEEVISIHDHYVQKFGGSFGIRDEKLLESAVFRCQTSFDGQDLYKTIFDKAAALFHGVLLNHPFADGNKRAALMCSISFLIRNKHNFVITDDEIVAYPLFVEQTRPDISNIASWFKKHCKKR